MRQVKTSWSRAKLIARWFGVELTGGPSRDPVGPIPLVRLAGGTIVLITGPSGAGKSTLLRRLRAAWRRRRGGGRGVALRGWTDFDAVRLRDVSAVDLICDAMGAHDPDDEPGLAAGLEALSRVGLGEVWSYFRRPSELSEGQRWRLRLAVAIERAVRAGGASGTHPNGAHATAASAAANAAHAAAASASKSKRVCVLAADEFAAPLDRVTALVVARSLRKAVDARPNLCAVVATGHDDLAGVLRPNVTVRCDFGSFEVLGEQ